MILSLVLLALFGCKTKQVESQSDTDPNGMIKSDTCIITFEKTPCFGHCPIFKLSIYESGYAVFRGVKNTEPIGYFQGQVTAAQIKRIEQIAHKIGFYEMEDVYDGQVTDLPSTIYMINISKKKDVLNRYQGPPELKQLGDALDSIIKSVSWKKLEEDK